MRGIIRASILAAAAALVSTQVAHAFVPEGSCAVIVASRKTTAEVEAFAHINPQITYGPVYESRNGWLAISAGIVRADQAASRLAAMKAAGIIPRDSYCSDGDAYTGIASTSLGNRARVATPPVQLGLFEEFDARAMSVDEKRFLQATLALEGYYLALLDGVWGSGSQAALERFTWAVVGEEPTNFHAAVAMLGALVEMDEGGWQPSFYPEFGVGLLLPTKRTSVVERDAGFLHLKDAPEAIDVLISRSGPEAVGRVHTEALASHTGHDAPYILRRSDLWVTSVYANGVRDYYRSHFNPRLRQWVTVLVDYIDASVGAQLIVSSIEEGPGSPLFIPEGSRSDRHMLEVAALLAEDDEAVASADPPRASVPATRSRPEEPDAGNSSGTGFFVDPLGSILTNAHVVAGCSTVTADGRPIEVLTENEIFDLAILRAVDAEGARDWLPFAEGSVGLNADITIAGFPLHGLLGGLNVTRGTVSSLKGLGGDETSLQISAPVQPGNSGGPVVNDQGQVVGVVVSKLDAVRVADAIGDMPQNINFAVRGELAKMVLSANGVGIDVEPKRAALRPEEVAESLQGATVLVECARGL